MNSKEFIKVYNNVKKTLNWQNFILENPNEIKAVENFDKFKYLPKEILIENIEVLKSFNINLLYDIKFWGIKKHESICAIATDYYNGLKIIRDL
jgi:hypothetical protein